MTAKPPDRPAASAQGRFHALDLLATLVAVVAPEGTVLFANAALEDALGTSRRVIEGSSLPACFTEPRRLRHALEGAGSNEYAALRYDASLLRQNADPMPVHVVVAQTDQPGEIVIEMLPLEQQARQWRRTAPATSSAPTTTAPGASKSTLTGKLAVEHTSHC